MTHPVLDLILTFFFILAAMLAIVVIVGCAKVAFVRYRAKRHRLIMVDLQARIAPERGRGFQP